MPYNSTTIQTLEILKACIKEDLPSSFARLSEVFPLVSKPHREILTNDFNQWAKNHAKEQPVKYAYAKHVAGLNGLINERYDEALNQIAVARSMFEEMDHAEGLAITISLQGGVYRTIGNYDLAIKTLLEANEQLKKLEINPFHLCATSINLAYIYLDTQSLSYAQEMFKEAYHQTNLYEDHYWKSYALQGMAKVHMIKYEYPEAKACLEESLQWAKDQHNPLAESNAYSELAIYHCTINEPETAEELNQKALIIREQIHNIGAVITSCIRLGELYKNTKKPEEAINILNKGLSLAQEIKNKPKVYQIHFLLSEVYKQTHEIQKSYDHFMQFHYVQDQVEKEENMQKINNARMVYDAEQTKKENAVIKKQKAEITQKNQQLQQTIDELTRTKISRKAKAYTLVIAIVLFVIEDFILHSALSFVATDNYLISLIVKMAIIFSLNPINKIVENYLLKRVVKPGSNVPMDLEPIPAKT